MTRGYSSHSMTDYLAEQLKQGVQGIIMQLFMKVYGWTAEQVELFLVELRKELDDKNYHILDHG
jgi:hypothetical protein